MAFLRQCENRKSRAIALVLIGASFAIQMIPPILQGWAKVIGASQAVTFTAIAAIYVVILCLVFMKTQKPSNVS